MNDLGEKARENLLNLHDVFLNADLQRDRMDNEPLDERYNEGLEFLIADGCVRIML